MIVEACMVIPKEEIAQVEAEARERRLLRKLEGRVRLREMAETIPECRPSANFGDPDRIEWHIQNYKLWLMSGGYGGGMSVAVGFMSGGVAGISRFAEMVEAVDRRCALKTNEILNEVLPDDQRIAILMYLGLQPVVYRFRDPGPEVLERARQSLSLIFRVEKIW